jgi:hypothetical protein
MYLRQDYEDEDHFKCDRVVEFRKRLAGRSSAPPKPINSTGHGRGGYSPRLFSITQKLLAEDRAIVPR